MAQKSLLDSTGYDAIIDAEANFTELYASISGISTGVPWVNAYFVGKSGDDSNAGTLIGSPKLTFASAISAASSGDVVVCLDAGVYTENISCKSGVDVYAPNATLNGTISLIEKETVVFKEVSISSGQAIQKPASTTNGTCRAIIGKLVLTGTANGVACFDTGSTLHLVCDEISINTGIAIGSTTTALGKMMVRVSKVCFAGAGTAVGCYGSSGFIYGMLGAIKESVAITGTVGIDCESGEVALFITKNGADTQSTGTGTISWASPESASTAAITGGTIDGATIGGTTPAAGTFTEITDSGLTASKPVFTDSSKKLTSSGTIPIDQGGTGQTASADAFGALKQAATETETGVVELATVAEATTGTDTERAVTPAGLSAAIAGGAIPSGTVFAFAMETAPGGYLECDGSAVSRTTYSGLFAAIGTRFGSGDGSTTFNLPDFRGQFLRGWDHGAGTDPDASGRTDSGDGTTGDNVGTKQADDFKSHIHGGVEHWYNNSPASSGSILNNTSSSSENTNATGGNETRPINISVMYCIKY